MGCLDLHLHSQHSLDGQLSPRELVNLALGQGVRLLSLTDHNTCAGVSEMARLASEAGLGFITGIELDCRFKGVWLHVLGYGIDPSFTDFTVLENRITAQERLNAAAKLQAFAALGLQVNEDRISRLSSNGVIWGEMIAEALLADPAHQHNPALAPYRPGGSRGDNPMVNFDWDFCSPGQVAHFPVEYVELAEAVGLIEKAGGRAVLAHPGRDVKENAALLAQIAEHNLWGLEAYSSYHTPKKTRFYVEQGRKLGLVLTCGSDFHGKTKPTIKMGSVTCDHENLLSELLKKQGLVIAAG